MAQIENEDSIVAEPNGDPEGLVKDTDPEERRREFIYAEVSNLLLSGIIIGTGFCICLFGILQQFVDMINTSVAVRELVRRFWFEIEWWYWLVPMTVFILMMFSARRAGRNKFLKHYR